MHAAAFRALGLSGADYRALHVREEDLAAFVAKDAAAGGFTGFNVTVPHKTRILPLLDEVDPQAAQIGAVNTVYRTPRGWGGCNTDAAGFGAAFDVLVGRAPDALTGPPVTVLGGGGAARAVVAALCRRRWTTAITWVTRDAARVRSTDWPHPEAARRVRLTEWGHWDPNCAGAVVVQATPVGLVGVNATLPIPVASLGLHEAHSVFDLVVPAGPQSLFAAALEAGVDACDGQEMLVGQGFCALERWLGAEALAHAKPAVLGAMRGALRENCVPVKPRERP